MGRLVNWGKVNFFIFFKFIYIYWLSIATLTELLFYLKLRMSFFYLISIIIIGLILATALIKIGRNILFATPALHRPVFVPSSDEKLRIMLQLAKAKKGEKIIDIGCGDGKILFALAKKGYKVEGIEINPILVKRCQKRIKQLNLEELVSVSKKNLWSLDFADYDLLFLYGTSYIMLGLEKKLQKELKPGARIVSNQFKFPNWKSAKKEKEVMLYVMK